MRPETRWPDPGNRARKPRRRRSTPESRAETSPQRGEAGAPSGVVAGGGGGVEAESESFDAVGGEALGRCAASVAIKDGKLFADLAEIELDPGGSGDGQSDDIPAMLADGEYVIDAETVAQIGNGSTKAGAKALDEFRMNIRKHKRSAPLDKIPPKTKTLTSYLKKGN